MTVELLRLLFDFGLLVLIWLVQLVVYPGFQYYNAENLLKWHQKYTIGISVVVIPLMFGQLITAVLLLFELKTIFTIGSLFLISMVWAITFLQFVPLHRKIAVGEFDNTLLKKLVRRNWSRTLIWTVIFIWTFLTSL
ncbi:hypothetical protein [Maribacter sp. 2308TA10-17]|uniref:hypothetical protein n=1 Tax=Maribacter sp. 2308TA10-17 TaxID=3386276 RepID=UPI0039BD6B50